MNNTDKKQTDEPLISFGLISDVQYCNCDKTGSRYYRNSLPKLEEAIGELNATDLDFIINLGDLIDRDFKSFEPVLNTLKNSRHTIYHLHGNHDYSVSNRYKKNINDILTGKDSYYSFSLHGFRFIALNSCEISTYSGSRRSAVMARDIITRLSSKGYPNAFEWNGGMSKNQIEWFRSELKDARDNNEYVLVFSHHTVEPAGTHNIFNREEILELISGYDNIIAWFCGHDHSGGYGNFNSTHFVIMHGMVETADRNAWAVVEVYDNKLYIKGRGREKSQILAY
ncbi:MAG: metallophosphoesterase [Bacteroidales bacterium]|nr:metallophosphoesterase [Bacteroidales bacterium]